RLQRRKSLKNTIFAGIFTAMGLAAIVIGSYMAIRDHQLATRGVETDAQIDQLYMKRVTPWIDYSFADGTGRRFARSTTLDEDQFNSLQGKSAVRVRYLPSHPDWNHVDGEHDVGSPWMLVGIGAG